jgi:hypothetical protein
MTTKYHRWPDLLLLTANILISLASTGDGRIFTISILVGILLRYAFLSFLLILDWRWPDMLNRQHWLHRMFRDPGKEGDSEPDHEPDTPPLAGQLIFLGLFAVIPFIGFLGFFDEVPFADHLGLMLLAIVAMELRDMVTGQIVVFRPGAGQQRNAAWNFHQIVALTVTLLALPAVVIPALGLIALQGLITGQVYPDIVVQQRILWVISAWIIAAWHVLLARMDMKLVVSAVPRAACPPEAGCRPGR